MKKIADWKLESRPQTKALKRRPGAIVAKPFSAWFHGCTVHTLYKQPASLEQL